MIDVKNTFPLVGTWIRPSFPDLHMVYSMIARIQTVSGTLFDKFVEWIRPTSPPVVGILDTVIEDLATAAERAHPNETVLLLKTTKLAELSLAPEPVDEFDTARIVTGFHVPPRMKQSPTRAAFDQTSLPTSMGIGGVAHSHPNGVVKPSQTDRNQGFALGDTHIIIGAPYTTDSWKAFDGTGEQKELAVVRTADRESPTEL